MWKDSIRNIVVIFQPNILRIVGFYVRHSASVFYILVPIIHLSLIPLRPKPPNFLDIIVYF